MANGLLPVGAPPVAGGVVGVVATGVVGGFGDGLGAGGTPVVVVVTVSTRVPSFLNSVFLTVVVVGTGDGFGGGAGLPGVAVVTAGLPLDLVSAGFGVGEAKDAAGSLAFGLPVLLSFGLGFVPVAVTSAIY
jgi:hypothetical protein